MEIILEINHQTLVQILEEQSSEILWVRDKSSMKILYLSPAYEKLSGYSAKSIIENSDLFLETIHPEDRDEFIQRLAKTNDNNFNTFEYRVITASGQIRWLKDKFFPIPQQSGPSNKVGGIATDITEFKQSLLENELIAKSSHLFVETKCLDDLYLHLPKVIAKSLGFSISCIELYQEYAKRVSVVGSFGLEHVMQIPIQKTLSRHAIQSGHIFYSQNIQQDPNYNDQIPQFKDNNLQTYLCLPMIIEERIIGALTLADAKKIQLSSSIIHVLSKIARLLSRIIYNKTIEEEFDQEQKLDSLGKLAGGIAHDFNNILTIIVLCSHRLREGFKDPQIQAMTNLIDKSSERATDLTRKLLSFARKGTYQKEIFSLNDTLDELKTLSSTSDDKTINFKFNLATDLHPIEGDRNHIFQAIMNLTSNARDAMPEGGELEFKTENITFDMEHPLLIHQHIKAGHYVRISVTDNGIGIPKNIRNRIFEPFFTTKDIGKGTGLGLSMVYSIMQNHEGYVSLYSEIGLGTTFHLYFPSKFDDKKQKTKLKEEEIDATLTNLKGYNILIADDEDLVRSLFGTMLSELGAEVLSAQDGDEALQLFTSSDKIIHLVILDVVMPKKDGIAVYKEMKKITPNLKVIFSSGYAEDSQIIEIETGKNVKFIQKPFQSSHFLKIISELLV